MLCYFQQFLLDLLERQYITCFNKDGKTVYKITDLGKNTLELTNDIIPGIIKLKVDTSFSGELKEKAQKDKKSYTEKQDKSEIEDEIKEASK